MMHYPLFQISLCFRGKIFRLRGNFSKCYLFLPIFSISSAKISDDLFSFFSQLQISNVPLFCLFQYIPLVRENYYFPPTFINCPLFSFNLRVLHTLCVFRFSPTLTMMHLCITQYTYWTTLSRTTSAQLIPRFT